MTGAGAGVGRATAVAFGHEGAAVGLIGRDAQRLEAARLEVESAGGRALVVPADVADPEQVEAAASRIEEELGPIEVWVNNAMTTIFAPVADIRPDEFRRATEVTYLGTVWGTMAAARRMRAHGRGAIVQVGSALAYRAIPLQSAYCGAKHAIRGFTDALRCELLHDDVPIHLCMVQLPALNTPQFEWCRTRIAKRPQPVPPIFQPEVAAAAIVRAARGSRREVYVGWPALKAIVGNKLVPGLADRYLARTGYDSQQTDEPEPADRPDNLFEPVAGDYAARGRFSDRARTDGLQLLLGHRRIWAAAFVLVVAALVAWEIAS